MRAGGNGFTSPVLRIELEYCSEKDIRAVVHPVLRHRLVTTYAAQAEGQTPDTIIEALIRDIPARNGAETINGQVAQVFRS